MRNASVVVEGIDGVGKTELCARLAERLGAETFKFPDRTTVIGKLIGGHLTGKWSALPTDGAARRGTFGDEHRLLNAELHQALQVANRLELAVALDAAMDADNVVIDRYWPSGWVYGGMDGLDRAWLFELHESLPQPDVFVLLDVDPEVATARLGARRRSSKAFDVDSYEQKPLEWFSKARQSYRALWATQGFQIGRSSRDDRAWVVFDARRPADAVFEEVAAWVDAWRRKENSLE